jgi:hypothetical protein
MTTQSEEAITKIIYKMKVGDNNMLPLGMALKYYYNFAMKM